MWGDHTPHTERKCSMKDFPSLVVTPSGRDQQQRQKRDPARAARKLTAAVANAKTQRTVPAMHTHILTPKLVQKSRVNKGSPIVATESDIHVSTCRQFLLSGREHSLYMSTPINAPRGEKKQRAWRTLWQGVAPHGTHGCCPR